jgi:chromosome segregation ATPase
MSECICGEIEAIKKYGYHPKCKIHTLESELETQSEERWADHYFKKTQELEKEVERLNILIDGYEKHNARNYRYFDEAQKRFKQMEEWVVNQHTLRSAESIRVCYVCAKKHNL